jgi:hypothetical protein
LKFEKKNLDNQQVELVVETDVDLFTKSKGQAARAISREPRLPDSVRAKRPTMW